MMGYDTHENLHIQRYKKRLTFNELFYEVGCLHVCSYKINWMGV